jgi:osmotically-inducible protein OsmY
MRTDQQIRQDVEEELCWDPAVEHTGIVVVVKDGIVTLAGFVPSMTSRNHVECAVMRILGVRGIANDISVRLTPEAQRQDAQIVRDVIAEIVADQPELADRVQVIVHDGHVTLQGNAESQWERQRAESAVRGIRGVTLISNHISIHPRQDPRIAEAQQRIQDAFRRNAAVDDSRIQVHAENGEVVLRGCARTLQEKDEAQRTAWRAPGVHRVVNEITVGL